MSKKLYGKKQREEQEAAAHVFQDFITTFQSNSTPNKTFVKSGVLYGEKSDESEAGKLYNPQPVIKSSSSLLKNAVECAKILKDTKLERNKKQDKPKSNLELLKDELKLRHTDRDGRVKTKTENVPPIVYPDGEDPNTTNLFVANLNPRITENDLMLLFGAYGPLASVKIMWPRNEEKIKIPNCGFVAFMSRKDAQRALDNLKHREDMRVGWGKYVEVPQHPIYIPNSLLKLYLPPPSTGLPFNAQPIEKNYEKPKNNNDLKQLLYNCTVQVTIPFNKKVLALVHRVVEFVVTEGPMFEAMIMNKEINNPEFDFLFNYQCPTHIYYRWKLYSILHGESTKTWSMEPFRMYKNGPIWIPPTAPNYSEGMPDSLFLSNNIVDKTQLSQAQFDRLQSILRNLTMDRPKIKEGMLFCLKHSDAINDSINLIIDSLKGLSSSPLKIIARLYLLSDVIRNCPLNNIKPKVFNENIEEMYVLFENLHLFLNNLKTAYDMDQFKSRVLKVLFCWESYKYFPIAAVKKMQNKFNSLNVICQPAIPEEEDASSGDEPLDGASLLRRSFKNKNEECVIPPRANFTNKIKTIPSECFVASKWDTIDPEEVQAQAMSTEKLYLIEKENMAKKDNKSKKHNKQNVTDESSSRHSKSHRDHRRRSRHNRK